MADSEKKQEKSGVADAPKGSKCPFVKVGSKALSGGVAIALCVVALVAGLLIGAFLLKAPAGSPLGTTTLQQSELDKTVASYTYNGQTKNVSARDVLQQNGALDKQANQDGTYNVPTADNTMSFIRNEVILKAAADQGITVSDEDIENYAKSTMGTSDYATIGSNYGLDAEATKQLLKQAATMKKLRDTVVTASLPAEPTPPAKPEDGNKDAANAEYAKYIIGLLGDEWDSANDTWAKKDGKFYSTLSSYKISNDSATYAAAEQAYYVAYSDYYAASNEASQQWTTYVNSLLSKTTAQFNTLMV